MGLAVGLVQPAAAEAAIPTLGLDDAPVVQFSAEELMSESVLDYASGSVEGTAAEARDALFGRFRDGELAPVVSAEVLGDRLAAVIAARTLDLGRRGITATASAGEATMFLDRFDGLEPRTTYMSVSIVDPSGVHPDVLVMRVVAQSDGSTDGTYLVPSDDEPGNLREIGTRQAASQTQTIYCGFGEIQSCPGLSTIVGGGASIVCGLWALGTSFSEEAQVIGCGLIGILASFVDVQCYVGYNPDCPTDRHVVSQGPRLCAAGTSCTWDYRMGYFNVSLPNLDVDWSGVRMFFDWYYEHSSGEMLYLRTSVLANGSRSLDTPGLEAWRAVAGVPSSACPSAAGFVWVRIGWNDGITTITQEPNPHFARVPQC